MKGLAFLALAAQAAPKVLQVRRRTWWLLGAGLLLVFVGLIWTAIALMGWFFGQVQRWSAAAPEAAQGALATMREQAERMAPGVGEQVGKWVPALKGVEDTWREVSGSDIGPVPRYPGLVRTYWHREGSQVNVHYEGRAEMAAVIAHYIRGFAAEGYVHQVRAATREEETHIWTQGGQRYVVKISAKPGGAIVVDVESTLD